MQVIVKSALEEDKRVARYPKPLPFTSGKTQTDTGNVSNSSPSKSKKDFMQLIFDDSLAKQNFADKIESKPFYATSSKFENSSPSKNFISSQLNDSLKNEDKILNKNVFEFSRLNSLPTSKHRVDLRLVTSLYFF